MNSTEHLLVVLAEEAAEVVHAVTKALRFGLNDSHESYAGGRTNAEQIAYELDDLLAVVQMLEDMGVKFETTPARWEAKKAKVRAMMEIARRNGSLES